MKIVDSHGREIAYSLGVDLGNSTFVHDEETINKIKSGKAKAVSYGYTCELEPICTDDTTIRVELAKINPSSITVIL